MNHISVKRQIQIIKRKNIIARAFGAIINIFTKLGEKISSLFTKDRTQEVETTIDELKQTNEGKDTISKKIKFKSFKDARKVYDETIERLLKATRPGEVNYILDDYRKRRSGAVKIAAVTLGAEALIKVGINIKAFKNRIHNLELNLAASKDTIKEISGMELYEWRKHREFKKEV